LRSRLVTEASQGKSRRALPGRSPSPPRAPEIASRPVFSRAQGPCGPLSGIRFLDLRRLPLAARLGPLWYTERPVQSTLLLCTDSVFQALSSAHSLQKKQCKYNMLQTIPRSMLRSIEFFNFGRDAFKLKSRCLWRGQPAPSATSGCEPGQVRKEAAVATKTGAGVRLAGTATIFFFVARCAPSYRIAPATTLVNLAAARVA